jgi:hypothetical protein
VAQFSQWWKAKKGEVHKDLTANLQFLDEEQSFRSAENLRYARLYGNLDIQGLTALSYSRTQTSSLENRVTVNIIQSCVDTSEAKIASKRPKPMFLTERGNFKAKQQAKKLNKFMQGIFYDAKVYQKTPFAFRHAAVFGTGIVHVHSAEGKICVENVMPDEIKVDDADGYYGNPQTLYRQKAVPRTLLMALYPEHKAVIEGLPTLQWNNNTVVNMHADQVALAEAWHLPVMEGKEIVAPGRHVMCVSTLDLLDEPWERPRFPFAKMDWNPRLWGYWAQGIAETLMGKQVEINRLLRHIQQAHYFCSNPIWMKEKGAKIIDAHLNNAIGNILTYSGTKPSLEVFSAVAPELYNHLMWLIQTSYEEVGITQLSASGKNPFGANASGKALVTYNDMETERFMRVGQRWENFHMDISDLILDEAHDLYKTRKVNLSTMVNDGAYAESIKFSDVNLSESKYIMQCFPVSALSSTPSAKLAEVTELTSAGFIEKDDAMELLDYPDLDSFRGLKFSKRKLIERVLEQMVSDGEYTPPEPFWDLAYALDYAQNYYNLSKLDNVPEERLELIRTFIEQVVDMSQPQEQPAPEMPTMDLGLEDIGMGIEQPIEPGMEMPIEAPIETQPVV